MPLVESIPVDLTEHVFRSIRAWLHRLYPDVDIQIMRDESERPTRPAFRLELAAGPSWIEAAPGWSWTTMSVIVNYAAAAGEQVTYDAHRVAGKIRAHAVRPRGRIPLKLYNLEWPQPPEITVVSPLAGTLPVALDVAVVALDGTLHGGSAPSALVRLSPDGSTAIAGIRPRNWPSGRPLASSWEIYAAEPDQPLALQGIIADGETFELDSLAAGTTPPTNRTLTFAGLRVDSIDTVISEPAGKERIQDVAVTLRVRALTPMTTDAQMDATIA